MRYWVWIVLLLAGVAVVLGVTLMVHREMSPREIDDIHPRISCQDHLLDDSTWWWVIPYYNDEPLTAHPEWVERVKRSGRKLGLHGIRHTYAEFNVDVSREYIQKGIDEFERAFGYKPTEFKPPKMQVTPHNLKLLKDMGLNVHTSWQQLIHKVHHCEDQGRKDRGRLQYELERTEHQPIQIL